MRTPFVLSDGIDDVALGSVVKNRHSGQIAFIIDYDDGYYIASGKTKIDASDWIVVENASDSYDDSEGLWHDEPGRVLYHWLCSKGVEQDFSKSIANAFYQSGIMGVREYGLDGECDSDEIESMIRDWLKEMDAGSG